MSKYVRPVEPRRDVADLKNQMVRAERPLFRLSLAIIAVFGLLGAFLAFALGPAPVSFGFGSIIIAVMLLLFLPVQGLAAKRRIASYLAFVQVVEPRLQDARYDWNSGLYLFFDNRLLFRSWKWGRSFGDVFTLGFGPDGSAVPLDVPKSKRISKFALKTRKRTRVLRRGAVTDFDQSIEELNKTLGISAATISFRETKSAGMEDSSDVASAIEYSLEIFDPDQSHAILSSLDEIFDRLVRWKEILQYEPIR